MTATATVSCDYCGLPVAAPSTGESAQYCCFGCRFAASVLQAEGAEPTSAARSAMTRLGLALFFSMNVMVFTFFLWSEDPQHATASSRVLFDLARYICLLLSIPVLLLLGRPLWEDAWRELRGGKASLNLLLLSGVVASFAYSAWSVFIGQGHVYFEVGCVVLVAISLGRWLEASGKLRTTAELRRLQSLLPDMVCRITSHGEEAVALQAVMVGDVLRVLPGETIAVDGEIVRGTAAIDQCMVTGESTPIIKQPGDTVYSGTTNLDSELRVKVGAAPGAGTMERLIQAVLHAVQGRTRWERLAEQVSRWFLPAVLAIALVTFVWHTFATDLATGMLNSLAVIVISCPCALGLATPMALWAAIGSATRRHVLVRDGEAFTRLASSTMFCFDKTGTLTHGCEVIDVQCEAACDLGECLSLAGALARASHHPLSIAIANYVRSSEVAPTELSSVRSMAGRGLRGMVADSETEMMLGSASWLLSQGVLFPQEMRSSAPAVPQANVFLACDGRVVASFLIRQRLRPHAAQVLRALRVAGARTLILSGDEYAKAAAIATELDCDVQAPLLPDEKLQVIRELQARGQRVVMVGDGLNDAPALAAADVGIALGCGADVSRWSGSLCLLRDDLKTLPWLVELSRRTSRTIRWNLLWAFAYNVTCIPLAALGWLHPAMAAAAMVGSSLLVVTNSLRLANSTELESSDLIKEPVPVPELPIAPQPHEVAA